MGAGAKEFIFANAHMKKLRKRDSQSSTICITDSKLSQWGCMWLKFGHYFYTEV